MNNSPITVLVVDDSAFMRKMVTDILSHDSEITVVGQARDGNDALAKAQQLKPNVITMDIEMPVRDGISALTEIMKSYPTPVVMLSSLTQAGAEATLRCLELGAVDFIGKPSGSISLDIAKVAEELIAKVKAAATSRLRRAHHALVTATPSVYCRRPQHEPISLLAIGSSTGGPQALQQVIPMLPADLGVPIVVVQHMPPGFTASLAKRLATTSPFTASEAVEGDRLRPGHIFVAPGGRHLEFSGHGIAHITDDPPVHGVRPSVDVTFASLIKAYGASMLGVILTGMGRDGARATKQLFDKGGLTLAEDESSCVVYGMPKAAFEMGGVSCMLSLTEIAPAIARACHSRAIAA